MACEWEEIKAAKEENRRELNLQGPKIKEKIETNGLDDNIFSLVNLNMLKISHTTLSSISPQLGNLKNLTSLMLENNHLEELPNTVCELSKLKSLDVSGNKLQSLPASLSELTHLQSLNANLNKLTSFPNVSKMKELAYLFISRNNLSSLPEGVCDPTMTLLSTIDAGNNVIENVPEELSQLPHLIKLNVSSNKLESLPFELSECIKLKELTIDDNKMKDRKLLKLASHSTKSLLAYLGVQLEKQRQADGSKRKGEKKPKKSKKKSGKGEADIEDISRDVISVLRFEDNLMMTVKSAVVNVRQYIVCCILRNLDFGKSNNMFKRFIHLQTSLHESLCDNRQSATIATHDLKCVKGPLTYDARRPSTIKIQPLFKSKEMSAAVLMKQLREEADAFRKEKRRSTLSGIHKYLDLLKDVPVYPCVYDADDVVISFPPITNSEKTKISKETTDILVEVTSSKSLDICKKVMQELLREIMLTGVGSPRKESSDEPGDDEAKEEGEEVDTSRTRFPQSLTVEQVKVVEEDGNLRVVFPSRVDLQDPAFDVIRNYE